MSKPMVRVRITRVYKDDAFYQDKDRMVGEILDAHTVHASHSGRGVYIDGFVVKDGRRTEETRCFYSASCRCEEFNGGFYD